MAYEGAKLSRKQKARVRGVWHAGISNQQRVDAAKNSILDYLAEKGYLRAELTSEVLRRDDEKLVRFQLRPGTRFRDVKIEVEGAGGDRARDILSLLQQPVAPVRLSRSAPRVCSDKEVLRTAWLPCREYIARFMSWTRSGKQEDCDSDRRKRCVSGRYSSIHG